MMVLLTAPTLLKLNFKKANGLRHVLKNVDLLKVGFFDAEKETSFSRFILLFLSNYRL